MTDKIKELVEAIKRLSKTECYQIKIESKTAGIFDSKIGGLPYWTPDKIYPINPEGKKLFLLAQINFDQENADSPLPKKGMLQFFISDDDLMGINFDDQTKQNNFRVIYHETIDYTTTKESIENLEIPDSKSANCYPVCGEYKISLHKNIDYACPGDFNFDKFFKLAYKEIYHKDLKDDDDYNAILDDEEIDNLREELESKETNHKMLGYPFFTQEDPRNDGKYKDYDTLLLQIDSEGEFVIWGDVGVCNFFIPKKSLIEKNFNNVMYNWDCS